MSSIVQHQRSATSYSSTAGAPAGAEPPAGESIQLRELVALLTRQRWLILGIAAAFVAVSAWWAYQAPRTYRATGTIRLTNLRQALAGRLANEGPQATVTAYGDPLKTQIQVLTSRTVASAVVDRVPVLLLRARGFSPALLDSVTVSPGAVAETLAVRFDAAGVTVSGRQGTRQAAYGAPVEYPSVRFRVTGPPGADAERRGGSVYVAPREEVIARFVGALKATPRQESDVVDVAYTAGDPYTAQRAVNAAIEAFTAVSAEGAVRESRLRRKFVEEQLRQNDAALAGAEGTLAAFRSRAQTFGAREKYTAEQSGMMGVENQRDALAADRAVSQQLLAKLESAPRGSAGGDDDLRTLVSAPGISANPVVAQLYAQLARHQSARDSLTTGPWASASTHPDVQRLDTLIARSRTGLVGAVRSHIASLDTRIGVLDGARARDAAVLSQLPQTEAQEARLANGAESLRKMSDQLREEYQRAKIAEAANVGQVEVVDLATLPTRPTGSGPLSKMLVGLFVGLVLGVGAAYGRESFDTTIHRREEVERLVHAPLFAVVPSAEAAGVPAGRGRDRARDGRPEGRRPDGRPVRAPAAATRSDSGRQYAPIAGAQPGSPQAEAYVTLRTNLLFARASVPLRRLVVTSPAPRDGKTTVAANLAACFATHGARVLLVDCDLRRPSVHYAFGVRPAAGLGDVLLGRTELDDAVQAAPGVPGLSLLLASSQPHSPSQLLGSPQMDALLARLADRFDLVVLDTPPILAVADAAILGVSADGVLLVLRAGTTARDEAQTAAGQLATVGARVLGVALNDPDNVVPQYSPYYYNYYTYYSTASA